MYKNLYSYGCSHSFGATLNGGITPFGKYLSNLIGIENFVNRAKNSTGNEFNRKLLISDILSNKIEDDTFILYQLTDYHRRSYELSSELEKIYGINMEGNVGKINKIIHTLQGVFNRNDSYDKELHDYIETYHKRLSGDKYIMFDDIFSTHSILESLSHKLNNFNFLIISWPSVTYPFDKFVPLFDLLEWSMNNELTQHHLHDNGDYHLSEEGHLKLAKKIFHILQK